MRALTFTAAFEGLQAVPWEELQGYRCSEGHGARDLESPPGSHYGDFGISVADCEAGCIALPGCTAVKYLRASGGTACYRQSSVTPSKCEMGDQHWTTYLRPDADGWVEHSGYNCSGEHGARDLESPPGSHYGGNAITVADCEQACADLPGCTAIRFLLASGGTECYRLADVDLTKCLDGDAHWSTYTRTVTWTAHDGYNCSSGHGAQDLERPGSHYGPYGISIADCEDGCLATPGCTAVRYLRASGGTACYRLSGVDLPKCLAGDPHWTTIVRDGAEQAALLI